MNHWQQQAINNHRAMKDAQAERDDMRRLNRMYMVLALIGWTVAVAALIAK